MTIKHRCRLNRRTDHYDIPKLAEHLATAHSLSPERITLRLQQITEAKQDAQKPD